MALSEKSNHFAYNHGTRNTNLMFDKISMSELECCMYLSQLAITCSKLTIETVEQGVKYVQS